MKQTGYPRVLDQGGLRKWMREELSGRVFSEGLLEVLSELLKRQKTDSSAFPKENSCGSWVSE